MAGEELIAHYRQALAQVYGGKSWILASDVMAALTGQVSQLGELGAGPMLCIAGTRGTGPMPDEELAPVQIVLGTGGRTMMEGIRASMAALGDLPEAVRAQVDVFDPSAQARGLGTIFDSGVPVAGRSKFGARPQSWQALEDKIAILELWDMLEIPQAARRVLSVDRAQVLEAMESLDEGLGIILAGDNREGFHGGAQYLRWVQDRAQLDEVMTFFAARCDRLRAMPFLEGIPCSIHAMVFEDGRAAVFRPCEMVVLRKPHQTTLHYARAATFWDPRPEDRAQMRALADKIAGHLHRELGYRGAFTLDGVMTARGFLPTELNPRFGAALGMLVAGLPQLPLSLMNKAIVEGVAVDWRPAELEQLVLEASESTRAGGGMALVPGREIEDSESAELVWIGDRFREAQPGEQAHAKLRLGPHAVGGILFLSLVSEHTPVGASVAPRIARGLEFGSAHWGLGLGRFEAARDVRGARTVGDPSDARG